MPIREYKKDATPQQEVAIALQDFFADKAKPICIALAPTASKLAWTIKKVIGHVGYEDLDQIYKECPATEDFKVFTDRAVAVERALPASQKPSKLLTQLACLDDLKEAESLVMPAHEME